MKQKFTEYFVPIIYKSDFDTISSDFLKKYCPEALEKLMSIPIWEIVENKIQLKIVRTERLSENLDVLGAIVLSDAIIDIYDLETKEYIGRKVKKAWYLLIGM